MEYISKLDNKTKIILKTSNNVFAPTATSDFFIKDVANNISNVDFHLTILNIDSFHLYILQCLLDHKLVDVIQ